MPISHVSFRRINLILLATGLLILLAIVATSLALSTATRQYLSEAVAAKAARSAAVDLITRIQDAETGQRGFLLTKETSYLEPYLTAKARLDSDINRFDEAIRNLPEIASDMAALANLLRSKLSELQTTVELGESGRFEDALLIVREGTGKKAMDEIRSRLSLILNRSDQELNAAIANQDATLSRLLWVTILGALAIICLSAIAGLTIITFVRELTKARQEVDILNRDLEQRVNQRTEALIRANNEIQRFAYIVTHDLRAPLVNIMGFTSELETSAQSIRSYFTETEPLQPKRSEAETAVNEDLPEAIEFIRSSTRKMDALINAILKISREGSRVVKPEHIKIAELLSTSANAVHHQATVDGGEIIVESNIESVICDRLSLDQVLGNLLDNAIKYKASDRPIKIVVRAYRERSGWIRIDVADNGRGIAENDHERIFELFRRSGQQNISGEGIGLAHVRTIVRKLGGDITLKSQLGHGSTFTVLLPPAFSI
ncbi:MAG TPA: ATP-binding protein [Beijerinckiaceae bacterium]|jgi:signal transduction histidine kinase/type II secretory pathway pseudopilin PulG|nr:ATP-binding protein [Beijerinckiaceae bacterium]